MRIRVLVSWQVAEFSAEMGKYSRAIEIFEDAARRAVDNNLLKYSARGYLLQVCMCVRACARACACMCLGGGAWVAEWWVRLCGGGGVSICKLVCVHVFVPRACGVRGGGGGG